MSSRKQCNLVLGGGLALATVAVAAVLFYRYADGIRAHVVRPAIETYFVVRFYVDLVPQLFWWAIPLAVASVLLLRRVLRSQTSPATVRSRGPLTARPGEGELTHLSRLLRRSHHSRFARVRLSRTLAEVAARLIAAREGLSLTDARQRMIQGYWRDSALMHGFLTPRKHYTARQDDAEFRVALQETLDRLEAYDRDV